MATLMILYLGFARSWIWCNVRFTQNLHKMSFMLRFLRYMTFGASGKHCDNSGELVKISPTRVTPKDDDVACLVIRQFSGLNYKNYRMH